jgi:hypothetical protein
LENSGSDSSMARQSLQSREVESSEILLPVVVTAAKQKPATANANSGAPQVEKQPPNVQLAGLRHSLSIQAVMPESRVSIGVTDSDTN